MSAHERVRRGADPGIARSGFPIRVLAPNPGPFTLEGTNTWIAGDRPSLVIDPGPDDAVHLEQVRVAAGPIAAILLTHRHPDHSPGAPALARTAGAPVLAFAAEQPDGRSLHDGEVVRGGGVELRVIHTPGHTPDHLAFEDAASGILFTGDAVLGRGTSVIDPPDGDLTAYLGSLERMETLAPTVLCPGHGPVVWRAGEKIREYLEHRAERDRQVERALEAAGPATAIDLVPAIYTGYPSGIHAAAARSVLAHLLKMEQEGRAVRDGDRFALVAKRGRASAHRGVPVRGVVHPRGAGPAGSSTA